MRRVSAFARWLRADRYRLGCALYLGVVLVLVLVYAAYRLDRAWPTIWSRVWLDRGERCGRISWSSTDHTTGRDRVADPAGAQRAEDCFTRAYGACRAASLEYDAVALDFGTTYTFVVEP